jgi:hypothetical protein
MEDNKIYKIEDLSRSSLIELIDSYDKTIADNEGGLRVRTFLVHEQENGFMYEPVKAVEFIKLNQNIADEVIYNVIQRLNQYQGVTIDDSDFIRDLKTETESIVNNLNESFFMHLAEAQD